MKNQIFSTGFILLLLLSMTSCRRTAFQMVYPTLNDGRYDSEFPYRNCSEELDNISKSVKKLYCLVEYDRFHFSFDDKLTQEKIKHIKPRKYALERTFFSESVHGTATIIQSENNKVVVLTCAHVVDYADTVISYFVDENQQVTSFVQSVAYKKKQNNFIRDLPGTGELDIIYSDSDFDIAFLGGTFSDLNKYPASVFSYPVGESEQLEWGSFVYIMGYPAGHQMVTRGIVSNPKPNKKGEFIIDALFNQGISGGVVLAVRDGVPNFELVGMAKSVSAKYKNVLKPEHESHQEMYNPNIPYEGELFVKIEKEINYGITFTISIGTIKDVYNENHRQFELMGYNLDDFFAKR